MDKTVQNNGMNKLLLIVVMILLLLGVAIVYTASAAAAQANGFGAEHYMVAHLKKVAICFVGMLVASKIDYGHWKFWGRVIFIGFFVLSVIALLKGGDNAVKGANRWVYGIQPSEFMKLGLFMWICAKLSEAGDNIKSVTCSLIQPGIPFALCACILLKQPNYSMFLMVSAIVLVVMLFAGVNLKYLAAVVGAGTPLVILKLLFSVHSRARIMAFLAEDGQMAASNYQGEHALQALGNGGLWGTGYGMGLQKLGYLPEAHKDVVYAVIGEEIGILGTMGVLLAFAVIFYQGFKIAENASTRFGKYLAIALTLSLFANFAVHVCVCVGLIPTTGQPLPFLSFGGTNLGFSCAAVGILLNISRANSGRKINEPYTSVSSRESSVFRNLGLTRSGV